MANPSNARGPAKVLNGMSATLAKVFKSIFLIIRIGSRVS